MRFKNENELLKAYAVAGTQTVLLAMDLAEAKVRNKDFMGFRISRSGGGHDLKVLNGSKRFPQDDLKDPKQPLSPIQSFMWKDYTVDPGKTYLYSFEAMFGPWDDMKPKYVTTLEVKTEPLHKGEHSVYFNFGVTGSQAYVNEFGSARVKTLKGEKRERALQVLGRELYEDGLKQFVARASSKRFRLLCAFYELEYAPFLQLLKDAKDRKADVQIVYNTKTEAGPISAKALKEAGLDKVSHGRDRGISQPHNKFMVLVEDDVAVEVWTGSTNITERGIFGHSNTGHWIKNDKVAQQYLAYWEMLRDNSSKKEMREFTVQSQPDLNGSKFDKGQKVIFSPRPTADMLKTYLRMMDSASTAVCIIYPFNIEQLFKDFYAQDRDFLRFIIADKSGKKTDFVTNDTDVVFTQGAILSTPVEKWVKEITSKATTGASTLYVHNKFFIVDPLGASPLVVSGSANFSDESLTKNDENMLLIKGNKRVADIYFSEFARMFDHFLPRYLQKIKKTKKGFSKPLDDEGKWCEDYYDAGKLVCKRKKMFIQMEM